MSSGEKSIQAQRSSASEVSGVMTSLEPAPIAIGKGRIGQLHQGRLRVWQLGSLKAPRLELGSGLRGVTALSDGSLAAVAEGSLCVLRPDAQALVGDKFEKSLDGEDRAALFGVGDDAVAILAGERMEIFRLTGQDAVKAGEIIFQKEPQRAVPIAAASAAWTDGHSVYTTAADDAPAKWTAQPYAPVLHLAPGHDGVWVSLSDHRVLCVSGQSVVHTLPVEQRVISLAADDKQVAVLTLDDANKRLHVALYEPSGALLWSADLALPSPPLQDKDPYVVLSSVEPIVAVGSAVTLQILDRTSGKLIGATP